MAPAVRRRQTRASALQRFSGAATVLVLGLTGVSAVATPPVTAAAPPQGALSWTRSLGTTASPQGILLTLLGDVFVVGNTTGNLDGAHAGNSAGDAFIARFDRNGKRLWLRQFSSPGDVTDSASSVSVSGNGDLYVAGSTSGDLDGAHPGSSSSDGFVARYDRSGHRQWLVQFGTEADDVAHANVVTSVGDIFVSGGTRGNLDGSHASPTDWDAFVLRMDRAGATKWVRQFASTGPGGDDTARAVAADSMGSVVIAGTTSGNLDGEHPSASDDDGFVLRLDRTGKRSWTTQFSSADAGDEQVRSVALVGSPLSGVLVAGRTTGDLDNHHPGGAAAHGHDAFVARFDGAGASEWITQIGSTGDDTFEDLVVASGSVVAVGATSGNLDGAHPTNSVENRLLVRLSAAGTTKWIGQREIEGGSGTNMAVASNPSGDLVVASSTAISDPSPTSDGLVSRYRRESLSTWVEQGGTTADDRVDAITLAADGDVLVAGSTGGNVDGDHPANAASDGILARYGVAGDRKWVVQFGSAATSETFRGVATNWRGDIYVAGRTTDNVDGNHPDAAGGDAFVARFDASGGLVWVRQFGTAGDDTALAVTAIAAGDVFVVGSTTGDLDGVHSGNTSLDGFVIRLDRAGNLKWTRQVGDPTTDETLTGVGASLRGEVVAGGSTTGNLDGKHGASTAHDALLVRFDRSGRRRWLRQFGSAPTADEAIAAVAVNVKGEIFLTGHTTGDLDGRHSTNTSFDAFVTRYSSGGSRVWLRQLASPTGADEAGTAIATTPSGEVFVTARTTGVLNGATGPSTAQDVVALRYARTGRRLMLVQFGGAGDDDPRGVAASRRGTVYVGGFTNSRLGESSAGALDTFLTRLPG